MTDQTSSTDTLSLVANVLQVASWIGLPTVTAIAAWLWRDRAAQKKTREALIDSVTGLGAQLKQSEEKYLEVKRRDPVSWLFEFHEIADRDAAISLLRERVDLTSDALGETFFRLGEHYNMLYPGNDPAYLSEAYRFARMAFLLAPNSKDARELVQELEIATSYILHRTGAFDPDSRADLPVERDNVVGDQVEDYLRVLLGLSIEKVQAGDYPSYEIVTRQARRVGMALLPVNNDLMLNARQLWAEALYTGGFFDRALAEIVEIEPAITASLDADDQRLQELVLMKGLVQAALGDAGGLDALADAARAMGHQLGPGPAPAGTEIPEEVQRAIAQAQALKVKAAEPFEVSIDSPFEIKTWMESMHCSEAQLRAALSAVGNSAPAIREYLKLQSGG